MSNNEIAEGFNMTELGPLPEGWAVARLDDVIDKTKQKDPRKTPEWRFKYVDVSSISRDALKIAECKLCQGSDAPSRAKKLVKKNDVIFATVRPTLKRLTLIDEGFDGEICSTAFCVLRAMENTLSPSYMFYTIQTDAFMNELEKIQRGASYPAVTDSDIKNQKIPLPPLPEQHRIAAVLSAVQDARGKTEAVIAAAKSLKKSLMRHLFTYGPVSAGAAESVPLVGTEIGLVPEGWEIFQTKDVCSLIIDCPHSTPKFTESGILVVRTSNVRDGKLVLNSPSFTSEEEYKERIKRGIPEEGDIIFTREAPIGEACLISSDLKLCLGQRMMLLRPDKFLLNGYFLVQAFYSKQVRGAMLVQGRGVTAKHLNVADVKRLLFPLPPLPLQQKIASTLSTVDKKIEAEENKKKALDELFKSLLRNLMTGKIRVNHLEAIS